MGVFAFRTSNPRFGSVAADPPARGLQWIAFRRIVTPDVTRNTSSNVEVVHLVLL